MAVDEETFYTITGDEVNRSSILEEMIHFYSLLREVGDTVITDFNEGSEIRNLLETFTVSAYTILEYLNEIALVSFVETADGEYLDMHGNNPWLKLPRDQGTEATGFVTFTIPEATTKDTVIQEGTTVMCEETGNDYYTTNETIIPAGEIEATATIICATAGEDGNVESGAVNIVEDDYINIQGLAVINDDPITGGTDYEEDEEYRERLLAFERQANFGSLPYYQELGDNVDGVHDIYLADTSEKIDGKPVTKKIYVNGDVKETPATVLSEVLEVFTIPGNIVTGHTFIIQKPDYVPVDLTVNVTVSDTIDESELTDIIYDLFDGGSRVLGFEFDGLNIGETLFSSSVVSTVEIYDNVESVTIINNDTEEELVDISVSSTEVLQLVNLDINQTIAE